MSEPIPAWALVLIVVAIMAIFVFVRSGRIVAMHELGLVQRLGSYRKTVGPGLVMLVPLVDDLIKVDMREQVAPVQPRRMVTRDRQGLLVDGQVFYQVTDPVKATFDIQDFGRAADALAEPRLRALIGERTFEQASAGRDEINTALQTVLEEAAHGWGIRVTRFELQNLEPQVAGNPVEGQTLNVR